MYLFYSYYASQQYSAQLAYFMQQYTAFTKSLLLYIKLLSYCGGKIQPKQLFTCYCKSTRSAAVYSAQYWVPRLLNQQDHHNSLPCSHISIRDYGKCFPG